MDINSIKNFAELKAQSSSKINTDKGFGEIFEQKIAKITATETPSPADNRVHVMEHGNRILNLLDDYARELSNPRKTLKHIEPLVENIKKEANLLEVEATDEIKKDSQLEGLIKDVAVTANVAAFKFERGDYI